MICDTCHEGKKFPKICNTCPIKTSSPLDTTDLSEGSRAELNRTLVANGYGSAFHDLQRMLADQWKPQHSKPKGLLADEESTETLTVLGYKLALKPRELRLMAYSP